MERYRRRIGSVEARFDAGTCGTRSCLKCVLPALPVVRGTMMDDLPLPAWTGCDGHPVHTLTEVLRSQDLWSRRIAGAGVIDRLRTANAVEKLP